MIHNYVHEFLANSTRIAFSRLSQISIAHFEQVRQFKNHLGIDFLHTGLGSSYPNEWPSSACRASYIANIAECVFSLWNDSFNEKQR